jgi:ligand-binding SRPBCC domain-containing protein
VHEFVLDVVQDIPRPVEEVFPFFADAGNLQQITPPFLHFQILTPLPIDMHEGTLIDYRIRLHGIPIRWRTRIARWVPITHPPGTQPAGTPTPSFIDEQIKGPYRKWVHTHTFEPIATGTRARDQVIYAVPGGPGVERIIERLFIRPQLDRIFAYRRQVIADYFAKT